MSYLRTIPTELAVQRSWERYSALASAIYADPEMREDPVLQLGLKRQHDRFCHLYDQWVAR